MPIWANVGRSPTSAVEMPITVIVTRNVNFLPTISPIRPKNAAPKTKGMWRVTPAPGGPGNRGGSFLGITKYCKDPEAAMAFIVWLESAKNQAQSFLDPVLFPSTPASYTDSRLTAPDPFFGGQRIVDVFADSAKKYPGAYFSPYVNA